MDVERQAEMLANRVRKTFRHLYPRFERRGIGAFRVYDWDIPEIRAVIDWYEGHLVVAEYARMQTAAVPDWLGRMARAVAGALGVPHPNVHTRRRRTRPPRGERYARLSRTGRRIEVREGRLRFLVNLDDYLDTGLFLDHRETRARVLAEAPGRRFLNLFGYTGSFTCAAAAGGAASTTTVDTSSTYLDWAADNLATNRLAGPSHALVRADVRDFLAEARRQGHRYNLVVVDPPSFSTRTGAPDFDVQRDHPALLLAVLHVTAPGGIVYFSTNHQRFEPAFGPIGAAASEIREITHETIPEDFRRRPHRAWRLVARGR